MRRFYEIMNEQKNIDKLTLLENIKNNDLIKEGNYTDKEINLFNEIIKDIKRLIK